MGGAESLTQLAAQGILSRMKKLFTLTILGLSMAALMPNSFAAGCGGCSSKKGDADKTESAEGSGEAKDGCQS